MSAERESTFMSKKQLHYFLIFCILFGIFVRFYSLDRAFIIRDGVDFMIAGIKLNHNNPYDARLWNLEHPPVGKWLIGFPTRFIDADYENTLSIPMNMYVWQYKAWDGLKDTYVAMRLMYAIFGSLTVLLVFLISRNLHGYEAGLWSATVASLSFDLIDYSRGGMAEIYMCFFTLATVFTYLKYLESTSELEKTRYLVLTFIFFTLNLGTRSLQPLFLMPILALSQFVINKGKTKENIYFTTVLLAGFYVFMYVIYPPSVRDLSMSFHHQVTSPLELVSFKFSFPRVIMSLFTRNSYLFTAGVILLGYAAFRLLNTRTKKDEEVQEYLQKGGKSFNKLQSKFNLKTEELLGTLERIGAKEERKGKIYVWYLESEGPSGKNILYNIQAWLNPPNPTLVLVIFFLFSFFAFGSLKRYGDEMRYLIFMHLPLFVLMGKPLSEFSKDKLFFGASLFLLLLNVYGIIMMFPYFTDYANFGANSFRYEYTEGGYDNFPRIEEVLRYLDAEGRPLIMSNDPNTLIFYEGKKTDIPIPNEENCNPEYVGKFIGSGSYVVYYPRSNNEIDLQKDIYLCPYLTNAPMELIKTFGDREKDYPGVMLVYRM